VANNVHDAQRLKELQALPLERKILITQTRIIEWYLHWEGKVYVSFSGGKDSTVLLHIARQCFPDIEAVFVDTGLEYPEVREHVKTFENVTWLRPEMNFRKVIETYGYPVISKRIAQYVKSARRNPDCVRAKYLKGEMGNSIFGGGGKYVYLTEAPFNIGDECCNVMKKRPMKKYAKRSGKHPIIGTMATESLSRKVAWLQHGCNAFDKSDPTSQPISFWTEQDVLQYIKLNHLAIPAVYGDIVENSRGVLSTTQCSRTGCVFCMFGCQNEKEPNRFQRLKITHPKLYEYCMRPWNKGGLGLDDVLKYINVKH